VEVELIAAAAEYDPNGEMVFVQREAERPKGLVDSGDVAERDYQIEVFVRPGLAPEQRIDTPPSVEGRADPDGLENGQELEDSVGGHSSSLGAA
jgi:hypothetical protein